MNNIKLTGNVLNCSNSVHSVSELHPSLAVNAEKPLNTLSENYRFISTRELGHSIEGMGYQLHSAQQAKVRNNEKQGYQKHLLRFRLPEHMGDNRSVIAKSPEGFPEIVVINSHDGTSSTRLLAGFFRLVCANGLISGSITDEVRIRHINSIKIDPVKQLEDSLAIVADKARNLSVVAETWRNKALTPAAVEHLASIAFQARIKDTDYEKREVKVNLANLARARRGEDMALNLWTVFNAVQENAVKAKIEIVDVLEGKNHVLRVPRSIDKLVAINKTLWNAAEAIAA